ncbi:type II toxin-antitoxin system Phd/YefM family antitoxin [Jiangella sp. DSM 45060]|uniref:type II toxin-antitoxin system Phd/YefM family antitoxin n=1 Tax=Jiangella sp. DSM 45060 TaxID=1798224 RepID=UPI0008795F56|nr:type II toxin-antitoxin system prevent-host-death family antitoxin [Jiangella sp. DSM 45060]SDT64052.1 prevent-host-death family protein [Jiangella sp. DSM 45060]
MGEPARIPVRDLRNHVSEVLRRVEAGETLEVTVNERPVALLIPRQGRPRTLPVRELLATLPQADSALGRQLDTAMPETTDDLDDPWQT